MVNEDIIKLIISELLIKNPELYSVLNIGYDVCFDEVFSNYITILDIIEKTYPCNHFFRNKKFILGADLFSLAYAMHVTSSFLNCNEIIYDFVNKKFVAAINNSFDLKLFNEGFSEFEIFMYLFNSIYFRSNLFEELICIEYESCGLENKRFEYSFVFKNYRLNVEVKALNCDPIIKDNISLFNITNDSKYYKCYFPGYDYRKIIPSDVVENSIKLSSNYRQLSKNIKKIQEKCIDNSNNINLGFIMINNGTSREEFISYLINKEYGLIYKHNIYPMDILCLFSMHTNTSFFMDEIYKTEHILTFTENMTKQKFNLFKKLRLDNYYWFDAPMKFFDQNLISDTWQEYRGVNIDNCVTIQPKSVTNEEAKDCIAPYLEQQQKTSLITTMIKD